MPEVVEVQIQVDGLQQFVGHRIVGVEYLEGSEVIFDGDRKRFNDKILDHCLIDKIFRSGKHIIFELLKEKNGDLNCQGPEMEYWYFVVHLNLNGAFTTDNEIGHTRLKFTTRNKSLFDADYCYHNLFYRDIMKRSSLRILTADELLAFRQINRIGLDAFTANWIDIERELVTKIYYGKWRNMTIYETLLDQKLISGLGNIYVNEVLHASKINPTTLAGHLDFTDCENIGRNIELILKNSYEFGGSSIKDYIHVDGQFGKYQEHHLVYKKVGSECKTCKSATISKITIINRSAFYCPNCQKER